jgi:hypothetical protein
MALLQKLAPVMKKKIQRIVDSTPEGQARIAAAAQKVKSDALAARKNQIADSSKSYAERLKTAALNPVKLKKGGSVPKGMHRMPDGSLMKNSAHKGMKKTTRKK